MGLTKYPGIKKTIGGVEYVIPPISLGALQQLQADISAFNESVIDAAAIKTATTVIHSALKRNYPEMTLDEVGEIVDVGNMFELFELVMDVSGLKRKALETEGGQGEAAPNQS